VTPAGWIVAAGTVGFAVSSVFSARLRLERAPFVLVSALAVCAFTTAYVRLARVDLVSECRRRPLAGLAAGAAVGLVLIFGIVGQPGGPAPRGFALVMALGWFGVVYGAADAALLTIVPVLVAQRKASGSGREWRGGRLGVAMTASLLVAALYHVGFDEFRGPSLIQPLIGNAIVTAGYLMTRNPMTPLLAHVIMHGAAVVHGMEGTLQLPPHY
jgi:hypothetical protein